MERHTILVVDDEPDVVKSVKDLLRLDYRVLGATRAADAVELLRKEEVHVVMTDQRMPEMTGVQFLSRVRGEYPEAMRLLFTGYADIRAVIDAINQGNVYRYITKPWDPDELLAVIREACERFDLLVERKRLFALLQTQNRELETANDQLQAANALKVNFIQVASHELRTPLTILLGLAGVAQRPTTKPEEQKQWLGRIEQAARRLQRIVDQLISMLVANQFDRTLDRKPTDLAPVLRDAAEDVRVFVDLRKQQLSLDLAADLQNLSVDPSKVRDSVNHLLLNAIKFTPDGGRIALTARRSLRDGVDGVEISVIDTGVGIEAQCQPRLFEAFFTGFDVSHHSSGHFEHGKKGIGLGLSIVRAFVDLHGGTISVKSEPGSGSTFTIWLPANPQETAVAQTKLPVPDTTPAVAHSGK
jgi:signal transduction histidine kinase